MWSIKDGKVLLEVDNSFSKRLAEARSTVESLGTIQEVEVEGRMESETLCAQDTVVWENMSYAICRRQMGREKYKKQLEKQNKKHKPGLGSKTRLSYQTSKVKKAVTSPAGTQHYNAIGAVGYAVVNPDSRVPETKFFVPGKRFRVRLRHCAIRCEDDAASCPRQAALKFADQNEDGPFDLLLFTGRVALARNCQTFSEVMAARTPDGMMALCNKDPHFFFALVDAIRRAPHSYATLRYHSQLPYKFIPVDEKPRMAKFRLVPGNNQGMESGLLDADQQYTPWEYHRDKRNNKSEDYLRKEFAKRLEDRPVQYALQIQVYNLNTDEDLDLWSPQMIWNEENSPWLHLMNLIFTTPLPPMATNRTAFNIVNRPPCLVIERAVSVWDCKSFHRACSTMYTTMELKNMNQINADSTDVMSHRDRVPYLVTLSTGHGTQGKPRVDVFITLTGTLGRTSPQRLDMKLDGKETQGRALYRIRVEPVGTILAVTIGVRHRQVTSDWMLGYVSVADIDSANIRFFPCYRVVLSKVTLRPGNVLLPNHEVHEVLRQERALEIRNRQQAYLWRKVKGLPSAILAASVKDLPADDRLLADKYAYLPWDLDMTMTEITQAGKPRNHSHHHAALCQAHHHHHHHHLHHGGDQYVDHQPTTTPDGRRASTAFQNMPSRKAILPGLVPRHTSLTGRARRKWSKLRNVLYFIKKASAKIPDGPKGDMCRACMDDTEFGRLFTQGPNPLVIKRLCTVPENLPVNDDIMDPLMERELSFSEELRVGRVFLADYKDLEHQLVTSSKDSKSRHHAAPLVLLYLNSAGQLVPLAIQLKQHPADDNPLFLPTDSADDWLLAKLWVRHADFLLQLASHMFYCHLVVEPFVVATLRQLSSSHPVYKLLKPHFRYILSGNRLIRTHVLNKGGALDRWTSLGSDGFKQVVRKLYSRFKMDDLDFTADIRKRGVHVGDKLTNYYYRDDGLRLWNVICRYCGKLINYFYPSDEDVVNDCEIQAWIKDIRNNGFREHADIDLPASLCTRNEISALVSKILYTTTCRHAATHSQAIDMYGHDASVPAMMKKPPPNTKGLGQKKLTVQTLPDQNPALYKNSIAYIMSIRKADQSALGHSSETYFVEREAKQAHDEFRKQLAFISKMIHRRNAALEKPYETLLPENVPNSVEPLPFMPDAKPEMDGTFCRDDYEGQFLRTPSVPLLTMPICMTFAKSMGGKSVLGRHLSVNMFSHAMSGVNSERVHVPMNAIDGRTFGMQYAPDALQQYQ